MFNKLRKSLRRTTKHEIAISPPLNVPQMKEGDLELIVKNSQSSSQQSLPIGSTDPHPDTDANDPLKQLSQLNEELYTLDISSYMSLRVLLETKLGRGAHVSGSEMARFKANTESIYQAYGQFNQIITDCLRYKQQKKDQSSLRMPQSPVASEEGQKSSADSVVVNEPAVSTSQGSGDDSLSKTQIFGISVQAVNSFAATINNTLPEITDADMDKLMNQALDHHATIMKCINQTQDIITAHRSNINPQAILNSQTEFGNLQRFFVHSRYKEMVKGCGPARVNHTGLITWAGAKDSGDTWMNQLLMCYWRHHVPRHALEKVKRTPRKRKKDENNTMTNDDTLTEQTTLIALDIEKDEMQRKKVDLMQSKMQNQACLDVVDLQDLFRWINLAQQVPMSIEHTNASVEVVETAVQKMGGWQLYEGFFINWMRQFYLDYGKLSVAFPIHGCRPLTPEVSDPVDPTFSNTPLSISMGDLFQGGKFSANTDFSQWLMSTDDNDQRYWNYTYKQTCKDLLYLHRTLVQEGLNQETIEDWVTSVEHSGLLKKGKYVEQTLLDDNFLLDDSVTAQQRALMHPTLVRIRERAIVINLCVKPEFVKFMHKVDSAMRHTSSSTLVKEIKIVPYPSRELQTDDQFKKGHRKSASTGLFNRTGMFGRKKTSPDVQPIIEQNGAGKLNIFGHLSIRDDGPKTPLPRELLDSQNLESTKRSISAPAHPQEKEVDPEATDFAEIKMMCDEILGYQQLPSQDLLLKAFKISQTVVEHYLQNELPAKYQSVY